MEIALDENKFDKKSMELLENFINEFDELFGEFLPREELIKRIQSNLNAVQFEEMEEDSILEITQSELLRDWQGLVMSKTELGNKTDFSIMAKRINSFMKALRCDTPNGLDIGKLMEYGTATDIPNEELEPLFSIFFSADISQDDLIRVQEEMKKDKKLTNLTDTYLQAEIGQDEILDSMRLLQQTKEQTPIPEKEETRD